MATRAAALGGHRGIQARTPRGPSWNGASRSGTAQANCPAGRRYRRRPGLSRCPGHDRRRKGAPSRSSPLLPFVTPPYAVSSPSRSWSNGPAGRDVRHCVAALPARDGWERPSRRLADVPLIAPEEGDADGTGRVVGRVQDFRGPGRQLLLAAASRQRQDNRQIWPHLRNQVLVRAGRELAARKRGPDHGVRPHQSRARIRISAVSCASWRRDSRSVGISQLSHGPAGRRGTMAFYAGPDLRIRIPEHWPDTRH